MQEQMRNHRLPRDRIINYLFIILNHQNVTSKNTILYMNNYQYKMSVEISSFDPVQHQKYFIIFKSPFKKPDRKDSIYYES